jgi:hypothetical protein
MTKSLRGITRRAFGHMCAAFLSGGRYLCAGGRAPLTWALQPKPDTGWERKYRADAQIILFSIPLFRRQGVGDGSAVWRESPEHDGAYTKLLEFTGRSVPEHAAGLNRFGFIRELSRNVDRAYAESIYFGLMTSSPEETTAEARKALHSNSKDAPYSVIEGRVANGWIETTGAHFIAPARTSLADRAELMQRARQALSHAPLRKMDFPSNKAAPRPFLHALTELLDRPGVSETQYAYNGRLYRLRMEQSPDSKAATVYRERHLIAPSAAVSRISGSLRRQEGGTSYDFRLWIEKGAPHPLPLRIEYRAKSYLRLTFEAQG